jgi:HSP20 family protein
MEITLGSRAMPTSKSGNWMWADALDMLERAERLHRQFFHPPRPSPRAPDGRAPRWEPPIDVLETEHEVIVLAALPGVDPDHIRATISQGILTISGERLPPLELRTAVIHRLELPQGHFERRVPLPPGHYEAVESGQHNGCLAIRLRKSR